MVRYGTEREGEREVVCERERRRRLGAEKKKLEARVRGTTASSLFPLPFSLFRFLIMVQGPPAPCSPPNKTQCFLTNYITHENRRQRIKSDQRWEIDRILDLAGTREPPADTCWTTTTTTTTTTTPTTHIPGSRNLSTPLAQPSGLLWM